MLGLEKPARGMVCVFGQSLHEGDRETMRRLRNRWGVLFQHGALFSSLTVADNIALPIVEVHLINGGYASLVTWLATFYQDRGWTAEASGSLVAVLSVAQAIAAFGLPTLAAKNKDRRMWVWLALMGQ